jgi:hypothetical protein
VGTCIAHGHWEAGQILGTEARSQSRPAGRGASAFKLGFVGLSVLAVGLPQGRSDTAWRAGIYACGDEMRR